MNGNYKGVADSVGIMAYGEENDNELEVNMHLEIIKRFNEIDYIFSPWIMLKTLLRPPPSGQGFPSQ